MRRRPQPVRPQYNGSEYILLVAAAERCVRASLDREKLPLLDPLPILDWLEIMTEDASE